MVVKLVDEQGVALDQLSAEGGAVSAPGLVEGQQRGLQDHPAEPRVNVDQGRDCADAVFSLVGGNLVAHLPDEGVDLRLGLSPSGDADLELLNRGDGLASRVDAEPNLRGPG